MAKKSEDAFNLDAFEESVQQALDDGREQATSGAPRSTIINAMKLVEAASPDIMVPTSGFDSTSDKAADMKQRWLLAMWQRASAQSGSSVIAKAFFNAIIHGRSYLQLFWASEIIPDALEGSLSPLMIIVSRYDECGTRDGPLYTEAGYRRLMMTISDAKQQFPDATFSVEPNEAEDNEIEVTDFWWVDQDSGDVWNAVLDDNDFVVSPYKTDYPLVPIVKIDGDFGIKDKSESPRSLLDPMVDQWKYDSRLLTQAAQQVLTAAFPSWTISNEFGAALPENPVKAGSTTIVPWGTRIDQIVPQSQLQVTNSMISRINADIQSVSFPEVMTGNSPGSQQSGYGTGMLLTAAAGRIKTFRENLEIAMERINSMALAMVERFSTADGIELYGSSQRYSGAFTVTLTPEDVSGDYRNVVSVNVGAAHNDIQRMTLGIRLADAQYISPDTLRDVYLSDEIPDDEQQRVQLHKALADPAITPAVNAATLRKFFGENWMQELGLQQAQQALGPSDSATLGPALGGPPIGMEQQPGTAPTGPPQQGPMPVQPPSVGAGMLGTRNEGQLTGEDIPNMPPEQLAQLLQGGGR
jgi:hypothetical protein